MPSYHFDCGNSSKGPIGLCARITAPTQKKAVAILQDRISDQLNADWENACEEGEYIQVYISPENITVRHIDEVDEEVGIAAE